jgi:iron complex transport system ATP-binding protein
MTARERARAAAFVPQSEQVVFPFSVLSLVLMGRYARLQGLGYETPADMEAARAAMRLTEVEALADRPVTELSGGELHRVTMARALAQETPLLLLDEPNAHLDVRHQLRLFSLLRRLQGDEGRTILMVVHDLNLAALFADRVAILGEGRLQALGTPAEVLTSGNLQRHFGVRAHVTEGPQPGRPHIMLLPGEPGADASAAG